MTKNTILNQYLSGLVSTSNHGFSLIEMVMAILIMSVGLLSLLKMFSDLTLLNVAPEYRQNQVMLAQELTEEIRSERFDENTAKDANGNWSSALGVNTGETAGSKSTYDDVDDFNGFSENLTGAFTGYTRSATVSYVAAGDLNTALTIPSPITNNWTPDYKKVTVTVVRSGVPNLQVTTVVSSARPKASVM